MDATANDILDKRFIVKAYPTLYFYQAKTNKVILYDGDRSEMHLIGFVVKILVKQFHIRKIFRKTRDLSLSVVASASSGHRLHVISMSVTKVDYEGRLPSKVAV